MSAGEAIREGSIAEARRIRLITPLGQQLVSPKVGVSLCLMGDTIMEWSAGLRHYEETQKAKKKQDER